MKSLKGYMNAPKSLPGKTGFADVKMSSTADRTKEIGKVGGTGKHKRLDRASGGRCGSDMSPLAASSVSSPYSSAAKGRKDGGRV